MVAEAILKRQQHFLEFGPMAMKPLGLREIATELGLHESTVSRVTNNKYMATPVGVFELKYFFSREMATAIASREKKYFSSNTPTGVAMYLLLVTRETVDSCRPSSWRSRAGRAASSPSVRTRGSAAGA